MIIDSWTVYSTNYCTDFTGGQCIQWTTIQSMSKNDYKTIWTSILFNSWIMVLSIIVILVSLKLILFKK